MSRNAELEGSAKVSSSCWNSIWLFEINSDITDFSVVTRFLHIAVVQGDQPLTEFFIQSMKSRGIDIYNKLRQVTLHPRSQDLSPLPLPGARVGRIETLGTRLVTLKRVQYTTSGTHECRFWQIVYVLKPNVSDSTPSCRDNASNIYRKKADRRRGWCQFDGQARADCSSFGLSRWWRQLCPRHPWRHTR